jgi:hypothetical protein
MEINHDGGRNKFVFRTGVDVSNTEIISFA